MPFAIGGSGNGKSQLESLGLLAGRFLGRGFPRLLIVGSASVGRGSFTGEALSTEELQPSGVSESVCGASGVRVFTVVIEAFSS